MSITISSVPTTTRDIQLIFITYLLMTDIKLLYFSSWNIVVSQNSGGMPRWWSYSAAWGAPEAVIASEIWVKVNSIYLNEQIEGKRGSKRGNVLEKNECSSVLERSLYWKRSKFCHKLKALIFWASHWIEFHVLYKIKLRWFWSWVH